MASAAAAAPARGVIPPGSPRNLREAAPIFFRHGSPCLLTLLVTATLAARLAVGGWSAWDLLPALAVVLLWPLQEWLIHVFILHFEPRQLGRFRIDFRVPRKHRAHHRDPWNYEILFIPLQSFLYSLPLLALLWFVVTPTTPLALTGLVFHLALTLHYEVVHFLVHTRVQPRGEYYRRVWRNHRLHHFKNEHYWFGVSRLEADALLRTDPDPAEVLPSPTVRDLYPEGAPQVW